MHKFMDVLKRFNIVPNDVSLFENAFSHSSFVNENRGNHVDYERIEFIGDGVLDLVVADLIYKNFPQLDQGIMSKLRASLVCGKSLSNYARNYNFGESIRLGHGEAMTGGRNSSKILEDVFEAFIAALYLDLGMDLTKEVVLGIIVKYINDEVKFIENYKDELQKMVQTGKNSVTYRVISESGPAHNKTFVTEVIVDGIVLGTGTGNTKKSSEQMAAKEALAKQAK